MSGVRWIRPFGIVFVVLVLLSANGVKAGRFEDELRAQWRGAWVVITTESYSHCDSRYTENNVRDTRVTGAGQRFPEGELGKVQQIQVRRERVELHIDLEVSHLSPYEAGPFTLYSERDCRLSLDVRAPREVIKEKDLNAVQELIAQVVEPFPSRQAALDSEAWNGREMDPYPADYERTLAQHAAWVAEQTNLEIDGMLERALESAAQLAEGIEDDPDYLQGIAAGVRVLREWSPEDCEELLERGFSRVKRPVHKDDEDRGKTWARGYDDGQRLLYDLTILRRLDDCYVEVPAVPPEDPS